MTAKDYLTGLLAHIQESFLHLEIKNEWAAFTGMLNQYSPRVDIAIGPFNINPGPNLTEKYNQLVNSLSINEFLNKAYTFHTQNCDPLHYHEIILPDFDIMININQNARCLIAIEIENTNSKKHMMGSIVNAASLGRVGIGIAYCPSALRTFLRILNYLSFLKRVGKNYYDTSNFLVLSVDQFNQLIIV